jgi:hypothetical protein
MSQQSRNEGKAAGVHANRLARSYHVSSGAVQKYAKYSAALDVIGDKAPGAGSADPIWQL